MYGVDVDWDGQTRTVILGEQESNDIDEDVIFKEKTKDFLALHFNFANSMDDYVYQIMNKVNESQGKTVNGLDSILRGADSWLNDKNTIFVDSYTKYKEFGKSYVGTEHEDVYKATLWSAETLPPVIR